MLQSNDIELLLGQLTAKFKAASNSQGRNTEELHEQIKWSELYCEAKEHCEEIEVHACGDFPAKLIGHTFPNETTEEKDYRKKSFQPITEPYWKKAIRSLNRVWSEQNYTAIWPDKSEAQAYFTKELPIYENVFSFFKQVVTAQKINDPNAVLAVSFELPTRLNEDGITVVDDTAAIAPYPFIYCCEDVLIFKTGKYALFVSEEKSTIEYAGKRDNCGYVFYLYDTGNVYRIKQIGKKVDWQFEADLYYQHKLGYVPCWKLRGTPEDVIDGELLYDSHFSPAIPHLNEAIILHSTLKSSISKVAYPIRAYYAQKCNAPNCNDGTIVIDGKSEGSKCSSCSGTGVMKFSPFRDYVHEAPTTFNTTSVEATAFPGITYVNPDSAILDFSKTTINEWIQQAFLFLNIDSAPDGMKAGLGNDATATKSKIDREEQFVSMLDISNELFELLQKFIDAAYAIRFMEKSEVVISAPKTFELISAGELTTEIGEAKTTGLPDIAMAELTADYVIKRFSQKGDIARITKVAQACDVLFTKGADDISLMRSYITEPEIILHIYIYQFIEEMIANDPTFLDKPMKDIKEALLKMAEEKATAKNGGISPEQSIDGIATGGASGLGDTVGGLTGIIQIATAVQAGTLQYNAAVAILMRSFKLTEDEAKKELGEPPIIKTQAQADIVNTLTS